MKYAPLTQYLSTQRINISMSFKDIEGILGFTLPPSAREYRAFWSNAPQESVATQAWLQAGFKTKNVSLTKERVTFERIRSETPEIILYLEQLLCDDLILSQYVNEQLNDIELHSEEWYSARRHFMRTLLHTVGV